MMRLAGAFLVLFLTGTSAEGVALSEGCWSVTEMEHCSWWQGLGEACYDVNRDGNAQVLRTKNIFKSSYTAEVAPTDELQVS